MRYKSTMHTPDAVECLTRDQEVIKRLLQDYERLLPLEGVAARKAEIVAQLCLVLTVHAQVEEDIFYPAVLNACGAKAFPRHVLLDHAGTLELVTRLAKMHPGDTDYDATVAVLNAYVTPHMANERTLIYPLAVSAGVNTFALGHQIGLLQKNLYGNLDYRGSHLAPKVQPSLPLATNITMG